MPEKIEHINTVSFSDYDIEDLSKVESANVINDVKKIVRILYSDIDSYYAPK